MLYDLQQEYRDLGKTLDAGPRRHDFDMCSCSFLLALVGRLDVWIECNLTSINPTRILITHAIETVLIKGTRVDRSLVAFEASRYLQSSCCDLLKG